MTGDPIHRRAREAVIAMAVVGPVLAVVFWIARHAPAVTCEGGVDPDPRAVDAYRAGATPIHVAAAAVTVVALLRLSSAVRGGGRPGLPTMLLAAIYAVLLVATGFDPVVYAAAGTVQLWLGFVFVPLTGAVLAVAALLLPWPAARKWAVGLTLSAAWLALLFALPAHYAWTQFFDDPLCLS